MGEERRLCSYRSDGRRAHARVSGRTQECQGRVCEQGSRNGEKRNAACTDDTTRERDTEHAQMTQHENATPNGATPDKNAGTCKIDTYKRAQFQPARVSTGS